VANVDRDRLDPEPIGDDLCKHRLVTLARGRSIRSLP
jgi:hypothetical protein